MAVVTMTPPIRMSERLTGGGVPSLPDDAAARCGVRCVTCPTVSCFLRAQAPSYLTSPDAVSLQSPGRRARVREWLSRYGVAECGGITCALIGSVVVRRITGSAIAAGYAAAWSEALGYSTVIIMQDLIAEARLARSAREAFGIRHARRIGTGLLAEFGPAGVLDTLLTRPLAMAYGVRMLGPKLGVVAGKLAADTLFYSVVIFMYERRKRARERSMTPDDIGSGGR